MNLAILGSPTAAMSWGSGLALALFTVLGLGAVAWLIGVSRLLAPGAAFLRSVLPERVPLQLLLAGCGAMPLTMLSVAYAEYASLDLVFFAVVVPAYLTLLVVGLWKRDLGRRVLIGFAAGIVAVLAYDLVRLGLTFSQGAADPIPKIGNLMLGDHAKWWIGYIWRTFGNGAGLGITYIMLCPRRWWGGLSGIVYGTTVGLFMLAFLFFFPQAQPHLFILSWGVVVNGFMGHWTYGIILGALSKIAGGRVSRIAGRHRDNWKQLDRRRGPRVAARHRREPVLAVLIRGERGVVPDDVVR